MAISLTLKQTKVLALLKRNARMPSQEIADRLNITLFEADEIISGLEKNRVVLGYAPLVDADTEPEIVRAIIEVQVQPERDSGFDNIATKLAKFPEVSAVYLVSGHYDLHLEIVGLSLQEVAHFVAVKLSSQPGVKSCQTLFMLKKYKEAGIEFFKEEPYERLKVSP